jgi:hypothetical protein
MAPENLSILRRLRVVKALACVGCIVFSVDMHRTLDATLWLLTLWLETDHFCRFALHSCGSDVRVARLVGNELG